MPKQTTNLVGHEIFLQKLKTRFARRLNQNLKLDWGDIEARLQQNPLKLSSLIAMEETGGEPDLVNFSQDTKEYVFMDCSLETPTGRRSLCYDKIALVSRKKFPPKSSVEQVAIELGIKLLDEFDYRFLQTLANFDSKTSSWIFTPVEIRKFGGALFADFRYGQTFVYHNGADSYYASRGFRGKLIL